MVRPTSVLIVSEPDDLHAEAVRAILDRDFGIGARVVDLAAPQTGSYAVGAGTRVPVARLDGLELSEVRSVWWRRPRRAAPAKSLSPEVDAFRQAECDHFLRGMLWQLEGVHWVNAPDRELVAARKLVQLSAARRAGLCVPDTVVTNDPVQAAQFVEQCPAGVIFKRTGTSRGPFTATRLLTREHLSQLESIRESPTTFQRYIEAECDVRVVWAGERAMAVRIDSQSGIDQVDSRLDNSVAFTPWQLPPELYAGLAGLMADLGLVFGVIDLRIGLDGRCYFLEVNPQGQFAYLEIKTGLPMCAEVAALLHAPRPAAHPALAG